MDSQYLCTYHKHLLDIPGGGPLLGEAAFASEFDRAGTDGLTNDDPASLLSGMMESLVFPALARELRLFAPLPMTPFGWSRVDDDVEGGLSLLPPGAGFLRAALRLGAPARLDMELLLARVRTPPCGVTPLVPACTLPLLVLWAMR